MNEDDFGTVLDTNLADTYRVADRARHDEDAPQVPHLHLLSEANRASSTSDVVAAGFVDSDMTAAKLDAPASPSLHSWPHHLTRLEHLPGETHCQTRSLTTPQPHRECPLPDSPDDTPQLQREGKGR